MLTLLLTLNTAIAASNEVSLQLGTLRTDDSSFDALSMAEGLGTWGISAGYALNKNGTVVASLHRGEHGGQMVLEEADTGISLAEFNMALATTSLSAGYKVDTRVTDWLRPYGTAQALLIYGNLRSDDDLDGDDNLNQLRDGGVAPGALATAGLDWIPSPVDHDIRIACHLELGYGYTLPMSFEDEGDIAFRGMVIRGGIGARF